MATDLLTAFKELDGDDLGVFKTPDTRLVEWTGPGKIVFSYSQRGQALNIHLASDRHGLKYLKGALNAFCEWGFFMYPSTTMVLGMIKRDSVARLARKCGFTHLLDQDGLQIYMRPR